MCSAAHQVAGTARWADLRHKDKDAYVGNIIALGDFNLPKYVAGDPIYDALRKRGLRRPAHTSAAFSNINNDRHYDQIMCFPGPPSAYRKLWFSEGIVHVLVNGTFVVENETVLEGEFPGVGIRRSRTLVQ